MLALQVLRVLLAFFSMTSEGCAFLELALVESIRHSAADMTIMS